MYLINGHLSIALSVCTFLVCILMLAVRSRSLSRTKLDAYKSNFNLFLSMDGHKSEHGSPHRVVRLVDRVRLDAFSYLWPILHPRLS